MSNNDMIVDPSGHLIRKRDISAVALVGEKAVGAKGTNGRFLSYYEAETREEAEIIRELFIKAITGGRRAPQPDWTVAKVKAKAKAKAKAKDQEKS